MSARFNLADIRSRMFNRPLLVTRDKAMDALGVMGPRLNVGALFMQQNPDQRLSLDDLKARAALARAELDELPGDNDLKKHRYDWATETVVETDPYELWNGVAIFNVRGTLMAEHGIDPMSGATGYDGLSFKCRHAEANSAVKGAILDIDSGGGEVVDLLELCSQLRAFADRKPLRAIVRGSAASAAYALAACAGPGNITAAPYSIVGSIGAIMLHADFSKQLEDEGIDVTMITSAPHKADASQLKPLAEDVAQRLQAMVNDCAASFIDHVADARGADRASIAAQEARFYSGDEAIQTGLVDKFMPWDASMREFAAIVNGAGPSRTSTAPSGARSAKGTTMSTDKTAPADQNQPEITQAMVDTARAEGATAGATAERERISALAEIDGESTLSASLTEAIAAGTSAGDFAVAQAQKAKATRSAALEAAKEDAVGARDLPEGSAAAADPGKPKANRGAAAVERLRGKVPGLPAKA